MEAETGVMGHRSRTPTATRSWKTQGRILPKSHQRECSRANSLIPGFRPPKCEKNKFLLFSATSLWRFMAVLGRNTALKSPVDSNSSIAISP